jgi:hypothetical protein
LYLTILIDGRAGRDTDGGSRELGEMFPEATSVIQARDELLLEERVNIKLVQVVTLVTTVS